MLCAPNDPDDAVLLSDVAGKQIDEVFIGSCMTNIGHFRGKKLWPFIVRNCPRKVVIVVRLQLL